MAPSPALHQRPRHHWLLRLVMILGWATLLAIPAWFCLHGIVFRRVGDYVPAVTGLAFLGMRWTSTAVWMSLVIGPLRRWIHPQSPSTHVGGRCLLRIVIAIVLLGSSGFITILVTSTFEGPPTQPLRALGWWLGLILLQCCDLIVPQPAAVAPEAAPADPT